MKQISEIERDASIAFNKQAPIFDEAFESNAIISYKRDRVRKHIIPFLKPGSNILELNCGTGNDALFFAIQGHDVHATDISEAMLEVLNEKLIHSGYEQQVSSELCSFTQLDQLKNKGPFDLIFSNFGGLNCTSDLNKVLHSFDDLLKPGGVACLVIISKFCLWEFLLIFKGMFKTATRRLFAKAGRKAQIEGQNFSCWYYSPSYVMEHLKNYKLLRLEGLCTLVPPSYMEQFGEKNKKLFNFLKAKENILKDRWPWRSIGDYFIITIRKVY